MCLLETFNVNDINNSFAKYLEKQFSILLLQVLYKVTWSCHYCIDMSGRDLRSFVTSHRVADAGFSV